MVEGDIDYEESDSETEESFPVAILLPSIYLESTVEQALTMYGSQQFDAFNHAVFTYTTAPATSRSKPYDIISIVDPISHETMKYKLNQRNMNRYKLAKDRGVQEILKGQSLIEQGQKLQRDAYDNLVRYGTVCAIAEYEESKKKKHKLASQENAITDEERMAEELVALEAEMAARKQAITQTRGG